VDLPSSSSSGAGENLSVSLALTFQGSFTGTKQIYMYAADTTGMASGWQWRGSWNP
jgi:hypothetical protein